ncbi:MAG: hypothetical protein K2Q97_16340 [Burkholderiaceae bacterium]|nr:hypothetical protein [Burkholderiaceae bacterium]
MGPCHRSNGAKLPWWFQTSEYQEIHLDIGPRNEQDILGSMLDIVTSRRITPLDILYGHSAAVAAGFHFMAHKTGFIEKSLTQALQAAGQSAPDGIDQHPGPGLRPDPDPVFGLTSHALPYLQN